MYAIGDCANFPGPKMGHMAVSQGMVAAANLAAEVAGLKPGARYEHEMTPDVDKEGRDSLYLHKRFWGDGRAIAGPGRFLGDADPAHQGYLRSAHA
jgi:NADH dehydrogenase FAD-containing subunit